MRLICLADTAEFAGGALVYAGRKLKSGNWSCSILESKSKLMDATIPRNELSAILLCTELAFLVKRALGDLVDQIIYCTDSTIALSETKSISLHLGCVVWSSLCSYFGSWCSIHVLHLNWNLSLGSLRPLLRVFTLRVIG